MIRRAFGVCAAAALLAAGLSAFQPAAVSLADRESAYRANNAGISFLEQFDYDKAADSFRAALKIDPALTLARINLALALFYANNPDDSLKEVSAAVAQLPDSPQAHYLLGLLARSQNRPDDAVAEFKRVLGRDPDDVGAKVNLAQVYVQERNFPAAITLLREAIVIEPYNVTAAYTLATALTRSGAQADGQLAMERFQTLRDSTYGNTYAQTYLAQGKYAEALASTGAEPDLVDPTPPKLTFADATTTMMPGPTPGGASAGSTGSVTLVDVDHDGTLDVISAGPSGLHLYRNVRGVLRDEPSVLGGLADGAASGVVAADFDNDGRVDLFVLRPAGNRLVRQAASGGFDDVTVAAKVGGASGAARSAAFADVDHDGDLDLLIGTAPGAGSANQLLRNNGDGTFTDITTAAKVGGTGGETLAVVPTDFDNRRDMDLLVVARNAAPALYQNMRDGSFRDVAGEVHLPGAGAYSSVAAGDVNKDGYTDLFLGSTDGPGTLAMSDGNARFTAAPGPANSAAAIASQFVDVDNDGLLDLVVLSARALHVFRNLGPRWVEIPSSVTAPEASPFQAMAIGDLDADGDEDIVIRLATGELRTWRNDGGNANRSIAVHLTGRVSNRGGVGSKVDLRAGSLRQRRELSAASPSFAPADIRFGLGSRTVVDAIRVLWPSGTLQTEVDTGAGGAAAQPLAAGTLLPITELDRKPSSCPFLYTWNGTRFEFVTDFMGGGELGYWLGPGEWEQPDPDEYVRIRGDQLKPRDGRYELRVTNELEETMFVDRLQLVAVDHQAGVEVYPHEGLKKPAPAFGLTTSKDARPVVKATDDAGRDVTARLARIDRQYPDGFALDSIRGYAAPHTLTLDLGSDASTSVILMTGWTDYAFSADNVAASHSGRALTVPKLEVQDPSGAWRTAIDDIGIPIGRPQTVVVDLRGKVPHGTRVVRIQTNMRVYWDQILVDASGQTFPTTLTRLDPIVANLTWRGFSAEVTPDDREPIGYDYARVTRVSPWKQMIGRYTREGDVRPLLNRTDDEFVISRPGDEIALSFDATALPPLAPGMSRTFLLYADGYSKEMDLNSASPDTVAPLPFHGMTKYPYSAPEAYPRTADHEAYRTTYNTRWIKRVFGGL